MADRLASTEAGLVTVRLSEIDRDLRMEVADTIIRRGGLRGIDATDYALAAYAPEQDPEIEVPAEKAYRVLVDRRPALGSTPEVWKW